MESLKIMIALAANEYFVLSSIDIRATFLQAKTLDRDVVIKPPEDQRVEGYAWKLKKLLYGLNNVSKKFWLKLSKFKDSEYIHFSLSSALPCKVLLISMCVHAFAHAFICTQSRSHKSRGIY